MLFTGRRRLWEGSYRLRFLGVCPFTNILYFSSIVYLSSTFLSTLIYIVRGLGKSCAFDFIFLLQKMFSKCEVCYSLKQVFTPMKVIDRTKAVTQHFVGRFFLPVKIQQNIIEDLFYTQSFRTLFFLQMVWVNNSLFARMYLQ